MGKYDWIIGVSLAVGGSIVSNLGVNLQKLTHVKIDALRTRHKQLAMSQPHAVLVDEHKQSNHDKSKEAENDYAAATHLSRVSSDGFQDSTKASLLLQHDHLVSVQDGGNKYDSTGSQSDIRARSDSNEYDYDDDDDDDDGDNGDDDDDAHATALDACCGTRCITYSKNRGMVASYIRQPLWWLGLSCVIFGAIADFSALGFASQIIVASLGASTLLSNIWAAPYFSGEILTRRDVLATLTIFTGTAISIAFANHEEQTYSFDQLFEFYQAPRFFFYVLMILTIVGLTYRTMTRIEDSIDAPSLPDDHPDLTLIRRLSQYPWGRTLLLDFTRFGFAAISGITGAHTVMFAKGLALLVHESFTEMWSSYATYLLLLALGCTISLQIRWLNAGLEQFDALYVIPVFQSFWIAFSIISGMIVYHESESMTWLQLGLFGVGVSITLTGVTILSQRSNNHTSIDRRSSSSSASSKNSTVLCDTTTSADGTMYGTIASTN
jgi:Magnesium transporter NIPA